MNKKTFPLATRVLSFCIACILGVLFAIPGEFSVYSANGAETGLSGGNTALTLSTNDILMTIARVAGPQVIDEMQNAQGTADADLVELPAENLVTTPVLVEADHDVVARDSEDNEIVVEQSLPQVTPHTYYIDQEMEQFVNDLQVPEKSKLMEQNLLEALQGLWLIKTYSGSGYQAVAMLHPDTLEILVAVVNSGSAQRTFTLQVVDAAGNAVEMTQVSAMIQKATSRVLTPEEFARYQEQSGISLEVLHVLAETEEDVDVHTDSSDVSGTDENADPSDGENSSLALGYSQGAVDPNEDVPPQTEEKGADDDDAAAEQDSPELPTGKLVEIESVVVEEKTVSTGGSTTTAPRISVAGSSQFFGVYGGISPFGLNHTVQYFIGSTQYMNTLYVAAGNTTDHPGTPDQSLWPHGATAFNGWYLDNATDPFDFSTPITENIRLYGRFSNSYVITFKDQNDVVVDTKHVAPGSPIPETSYQIVPPANQHLMHWYEEGEDPTVPFVFGTSASKDLTLKPFFSNEFYIIFISQGTQTDPQTVLANGTVIPPVNPTREGYTFQHWSLTENGSTPYNFGTPVTDHLKLYAVWQAKMVDYTVVYWVEKPNVAGGPTSASDYAYADSVVLTALAGTNMTMTESTADPHIAATRTDQTNPLRYSNFERSDTREISGNGTTLINVYYHRVVYHYDFYMDVYNLGLGPEGNRSQLYSGGQYIDFKDNTQVSLRLSAKFQQDISNVWPTVIASSSISYSYAGFAPPTAVNSSIFVTRRFEVDKQMINQSNPRPTAESARTYNMTTRWALSSHEYYAEYWLEILDQSDPLPTDRLYNGTYFRKKTEYDQTIQETGGDLQGKGLDGFEVVNLSGEGTTGPGDTKRFYYTRIRKNLFFDAQGGTPVSPIYQLPFELPLKQYAPADPIRSGYTFLGWFRDAELNEEFDFEIATMPKDDLTLYAKWESNDFTVTYYDRPGSTDVIATQGYGLGMTVTYPSQLYQEGDFVPGYGQFLGWYWILPTVNVLTKFSTEIPVYQDINLYATWKTSDFTVTYDRGAGTGTPPTDAQVYDLGRNVSLKEAEGLIPPAGEVFYGWLPDVGGTGELYFPRNLFAIQGDTVFTAQYGVPSAAYTITFKAGYPGNTDSETWYVPMGRSVYLLDDIYTRPYASMIGWSETEGATTAQYALGELLTVDKNTTLYAVWDMKTYNVYFQADSTKGELQYGATTQDTVTFSQIPHGTTWDSAITLPTPIAKPGYLFVGWAPSIPSGTSQIVSDMTFVAQFDPYVKITITAGTKQKVYDGTPLTDNTATVTGLDTGLYNYQVTMTPASTITNVGTANNQVATYKITQKSDGTDVTGNFAVTTVDGTLTVKPCPVTIQADNKSKVFSAADPALTATVTGKPAAGTALNYTLSRVAGENVGTYDIAVTLGSNPNYTVTTVKGTFTITQQEGVMQASVKDGGVNVLYDAQAHGITVVVTGVTSGYTIRYSATENGTYTLTQPSKVNAADSGRIYYEVTHPNHGTVKGYGTVTIRKRVLTVRVPSETRTYTGNTITVAPTANLVAGGDGLVSGHTLTAVGQGSGKEIGTYPITLGSATVRSGSQDVSANYSVTTLNGILTIETNIITLTVRMANVNKRSTDPDPDFYSLVTVEGLPQGVAVKDALEITRDGSATPSTRGTFNINIVSKDPTKYNVVYSPVAKLTVK